MAICDAISSVRPAQNFTLESSDSGAKGSKGGKDGVV